MALSTVPRSVVLPAGTARALAATLLVLVGWHAESKVHVGLLPEMLWACHLSTVTCAFGLLLGLPRLAVFGGLFHLGCGFPGWLLEVAFHGTTPSSFAVHVATPLAGVWAARLAGVPRWLPAAGGAFWLGSQLVGRLCPPEMNVNVAWRPFDGLPAGVPLWASHLLNLSIVLGSMRLILLAADRLGLARDD